MKLGFRNGLLLAGLTVLSVPAVSAPARTTSDNINQNPVNNPAPGNAATLLAPNIATDALRPQRPTPDVDTSALRLPPPEVENPRQSAAADRALEARVRQAFAERDPELGRMVTVSAQDGRVHLYGEVPTSADRDLLVGLARGRVGSVNVENNLTVGRGL